MIYYIYNKDIIVFFPLNEECIFENVSLVTVNINNDTNNVVNMKIPYC